MCNSTSENLEVPGSLAKLAPRNDGQFSNRGPPMTPETFSSWQGWAGLSAVFAALTAIFAKVGVEDINPDLATFIRTIIVLISLSLILFSTSQFANPGPISPKSWIFLVLSGLGTGASWLCYFRALQLW